MMLDEKIIQRFQKAFQARQMKGFISLVRSKKLPHDVYLDQGRGLIHYAAMYKMKELVEVLIDEFHISPNAKDMMELTSMHYAAKCNSVEEQLQMRDPLAPIPLYTAQLTEMQSMRRYSWCRRELPVSLRIKQDSRQRVKLDDTPVDIANRLGLYDLKSAMEVFEEKLRVRMVYVYTQSKTITSGALLNLELKKISQFL